MRPLLHQGKAKPVAQGEIIDPKKFSASTEDVYREFCAFKLCSLAGVDVASILFFFQIPIDQRILYNIGWYPLIEYICMSVYIYF